MGSDDDNRSVLDVLCESLLLPVLSILAPRERALQQPASLRVEHFHRLDGTGVCDEWRRAAEKFPLVESLGSSQPIDILRLPDEWLYRIVFGSEHSIAQIHERDDFGNFWSSRRAMTIIIIFLFPLSMSFSLVRRCPTCVSRFWPLSCFALCSSRRYTEWRKCCCDGTHRSGIHRRARTEASRMISMLAVGAPAHPRLPRDRFSIVLRL